MPYSVVELVQLFAAVEQALLKDQTNLDAADLLNANHGAHMVDIFREAWKSIQYQPDLSLADAMDAAAQCLESLLENGSAAVYARGLHSFATALRREHLSYDDLFGYLGSLLRDKNDSEALSGERNSDTLKALLRGLSLWCNGDTLQASSGMDMAFLFDVGMIYLQAKGRGGSRAQVLADAAASASPLSQVPHRLQSGRLALQVLLEGMAELSV